MNMFNTLDKDIQLNIEQVKWREVRNVVHRYSPELAEKCDNINKCGISFIQNALSLWCIYC